MIFPIGIGLYLTTSEFSFFTFNYFAIIMAKNETSIYPTQVFTKSNTIPYSLQIHLRYQQPNENPLFSYMEKVTIYYHMIDDDFSWLLHLPAVYRIYNNRQKRFISLTPGDWQDID